MIYERHENRHLWNRFHGTTDADWPVRIKYSGQPCNKEYLVNEHQINTGIHYSVNSTIDSILSNCIVYILYMSKVPQYSICGMFAQGCISGLWGGKRAAMQTQGKLTEILAPETQLLKLREQSHHIYTKQPEKHMAETVGHSGWVFTKPHFMGLY